MQSTTILMHAIGLAPLGCDEMRKIRYPFFENWTAYAEDNVDKFLQYLEETDFTIMKDLIEEETRIYQKGQSLTYVTDPYYAITIITDTTERSPTFSLLPFKNKYNNDEGYRNWCNLVIDNKDSKEEEWDGRV